MHLTMAPSVLPPGLASDLSVRLHGQHLARELVLTAVRGYLEPPQPHKALALSFHGWSGTGKNFVARLLAENLYRDGLRSDCVKVFIATFHFPHLKYVDLYQVRLGSARASFASRVEAGKTLRQPERPASVGGEGGPEASHPLPGSGPRRSPGVGAGGRRDRSCKPHRHPPHTGEVLDTWKEGFCPKHHLSRAISSARR